MFQNVSSCQEQKEHEEDPKEPLGFGGEKAKGPCYHTLPRRPQSDSEVGRVDPPFRCISASTQVVDECGKARGEGREEGIHQDSLSGLCPSQQFPFGVLGLRRAQNCEQCKIGTPGSSEVYKEITNKTRLEVKTRMLHAGGTRDVT